MQHTIAKSQMLIDGRLPLPLCVVVLLPMQHASSHRNIWNRGVKLAVHGSKPARHDLFWAHVMSIWCLH